jgi:hypothetical protein
MPLPVRVQDKINSYISILPRQGSDGTIGGTGSINTVPKFTPDGTTLGDSSIQDNGTKVTISNITKIPFLEYDQSITASGEIVYFGKPGSRMIAGRVYYLDGSDPRQLEWNLADATLESRSKYLIAIAIGESPEINGMLLRGFARIESVAEYISGDILYLSDTPGYVTNVAPSNVRIVGYVVDNSIGQLYFCPDTNWMGLGTSLKKITKELTFVDINGLHNDAAVIALDINADIKIINVKCYADAQISGFTTLTLFDSNSSLPIAELNISTIENNYHYNFGIGKSGTSIGYNLRYPTTSLHLIALDGPMTGEETSLIVEISYFD